MMSSSWGARAFIVAVSLVVAYHLFVLTSSGTGEVWLCSNQESCSTLCRCSASSSFTKTTLIHPRNLTITNPTTKQQLLIPEKPDPTCRERVLKAIENIVQLSDSRFATCPITSQVQITVDDSSWHLTSLDENGKRKTMGGDEFYITYTDASMVVPGENRTHVTAVARAMDQGDGTYQLDFVSSPMLSSLQKLTGMGTLTVSFEYTCGVGRMGQPSKDHWNSGGATHTTYTLHNVKTPPFRAFQPTTSPVNLGSYDAILVMGDSVMSNFVAQGEGWFGKKNLYKGKNPESALNTKTVDKWLEQLHGDFGQAMLNKSTHTAVLTGSSTWDLLRNDVDQWNTWEDHLQACRTLVNTIRGELPHVDLIWKSATALHISNFHYEEMADTFWSVERVRYMSESRSYEIDQLQKELMRELNITVLDVYETTYLSADHSRSPEDARHYSYYLNRMMLNWFYSKEEKAT